MSGDAQQAITHVLQQDSTVLGGLLDRLNHHKHLNKIFSEVLDPKMVKHCQIANFQDKHLVVLTHNALWATQFRFQMPTLLAKLRSYPEFKDIKTMQCKLIPATHERRIPEAHKRPAIAKLSPETAEAILETAKNIRHESLRKVMEKIAKHVK